MCVCVCVIDVTVSGPGLVLVLIHASVKGTLRRDTIRDTWLSAELLQLVSITYGVTLDYRCVHLCVIHMFVCVCTCE